jgi:hypothetical protein
MDRKEKTGMPASRDNTAPADLSTVGPAKADASREWLCREMDGRSETPLPAS